MKTIPRCEPRLTYAPARWRAEAGEAARLCQTRSPACLIVRSVVFSCVWIENDLDAGMRASRRRSLRTSWSPAIGFVCGSLDAGTGGRPLRRPHRTQRRRAIARAMSGPSPAPAVGDALLAHPTHLAAIDPVERRDLASDGFLHHVGVALTPCSNAFSEVEPERPVGAGDLLSVETLPSVVRPGPRPPLAPAVERRRRQANHISLT